MLSSATNEASSFVVEFADSLCGEVPLAESPSGTTEADDDLPMRLIVGELRPDCVDAVAVPMVTVPVLLRGIGCALMRAKMARPLYVGTLTRRYWKAFNASSSFLNVMYQLLLPAYSQLMHVGHCSCVNRFTIS